jgi:hypothetical protein
LGTISVSRRALLHGLVFWLLVGWFVDCLLVGLLFVGWFVGCLLVGLLVLVVMLVGWLFRRRVMY